MTKKMNEALHDLPIEHVPSESSLSRDKKTMYWMGISGKTYHYNTLKALMNRGFLQFIPTGFDFARLVRKKKEHNTRGYERWNQMFL